MRLKVVRTTFTDRSTIGELFVDDSFACFTLEDMVRPVKVAGKTAIPEGVYVVSVSFSNRFRRPLPEIHDVPNYTGVRIHAGNTDAHTEGCVLVGKTKREDFIGDSRAAFDALFARIQDAAQKEKIFIEVTSAVPATRGIVAPAAATRGVGAVARPPARLGPISRAGGGGRAKRVLASATTAAAKKRALKPKPAAEKRRPSGKHDRPVSAAKGRRKAKAVRRR